MLRQGSTWKLLRPHISRSGARCIVRAASSDASQDVKSKLKDAELLKTDCFVGGEWSGAESGETMPVRPSLVLVLPAQKSQQQIKGHVQAPSLSQTSANSGQLNYCTNPNGLVMCDLNFDALRS